MEIIYGAEPEGEKLAEFEPGTNQALTCNANVDRLNRLLFPPFDYAVKGIRP